MSIENILRVCRTIKHDRDIESAFKHLKGEIRELKDEISSLMNDQNPGPDGVIGEAVDCILCLVDIIYQEDSSITTYEINKVIHDKLEKWKRVYDIDEEQKRLLDLCSAESDIKFYNSMRHPSQHVEVSQVDKLKLKLYGPDGVGCTNFNFSRGSTNATDEQIASEINKVIEQIESGNIEICQNI